MMTSTALENALIIKGYLMAGNAPTQLLAGMEVVIHDLRLRGPRVREEISNEKPTIKAIVAAPDHIPAAEKMVAPQVQDQPAGDAGPAEKKERKGWTPEARARQAEMMRKRMAERKGKPPSAEQSESDPEGN